MASDEQAKKRAALGKKLSKAREAAKITGGNGGGRPDFAKAGGKDASKLEDAIKAVPELVKAQMR